MFESVKDRKAREEELLRQQETLAALRQVVAKVSDGINGSRVALRSMERSQENLDGALNQVVSMVHKIRKNETAQAEEEERLRQQLTELYQSFRQKEELYRKELDTAGKQQKALLACVEQGREGDGSLSDLNQWAAGVPEELTGMQQKITAMEEQAKTMGVLSLNAAIEAGRMGDSGRKFVAVAEEVRSSAGEYRTAAQELGQEFLKMQEDFQAAAENLKQLTLQLAEWDASIEKAALELEGCLDKLSLEQPAENGSGSFLQKNSDSGRLEKLCKSWEQAAGIQSRQENCFEQILKQMEAAGASYMKEQQQLELLKSWQEQIQKAIEERELWG